MSMFQTDPDCIRQREYVNIPAWHKAGFTGKGVNILCDDVGGNHVANVKEIIQVILPDAVIYTGGINYTKDNDGIKECKIYCQETKESLPFDEFIKKYNISLINNSTEGGNGEEILPEAVFMKEKIKQYNLIMCGASGNVYMGETDQPYNGACIVVSSVNLKNGKPTYGMKSIGPNVDFVMFHGFQSGSSFSSPFLLGMAGLLRCKYPNISKDEVYQYFKEHCEKIGNAEKSEQYGWGVPIMGNTKTEIKLQIGNSKMYVDGNAVILDQPPTIDKDTGRTLVPVRAIAQAFKSEVFWDEKTKTITLIK